MESRYCSDSADPHIAHSDCMRVRLRLHLRIFTLAAIIYSRVLAEKDAGAIAS
jgi:hypothetical protein